MSTPGINQMLEESLEKIDDLIDGAWKTRLYSDDMVAISVNRKTLEPVLSRYRKKMIGMQNMRWSLKVTKQYFL